jgi:chromosomal replication initiation ATPase DnaA
MWPKWYRPPTRASWSETVSRVAEFYGVTEDDIRGPYREARLVDARWVCAKALRAKGRLSFPRIGQILNRDHTSIVHACQNFRYRAAARPDMIIALNRALVR